MISDDEYLERIVAGIQSATSNGAEVSWSEIINGRQFDVVVRFALALVRYLVVVEVKNRNRKAEASDIDAFVTKSRDQKANKAVFVTAAGYQELFSYENSNLWVANRNSRLENQNLSET